MTPAKRLDGVDLRVGIPEADTARIAAALRLDRAQARERAVHLMDDFSESSGSLAAAGATARLVEMPWASELVVQLQPVRRAQLGPHWLSFYSDTRHRLRITEEWTTDQRIMTASLTARLDATVPALASTPDPDGARPARELLSAVQRDFLSSCIGLVVEDDRLTLAGPILERAWWLRQYDLNFHVRRWTARPRGQGIGLDLIDLERPSSAADAPFLLPAMRSLARRQGVDPGEDIQPIVLRAISWLSGRRR